MSSKKFTLFINSKNRETTENIYNFNIYLKNQIMIKPNEYINISVMGFYMLNSMYNVNSITKNNTFIIKRTNLDGSNIINTDITVPYGNYSVLTFRDTINNLLKTSSLTNISLTYNIPTNNYTFNNTNTIYKWYIIPNLCYKLLGITTETDISNGFIGKYVNMVNYQQIYIRCPSLSFTNFNQDNIRDKNNNLNISDILFSINKGDIEPYRIINYKNEDSNSSFSYNITNTILTELNLQLYNENDEMIYDASDYILELQISITDKNNDKYMETGFSILKYLDEINTSVLSIFFKFENNYLT